MTAAEWNFVIGAGAALFDRLNSMPTRLGEVVERISQGPITSADDVFLFKKFNPLDGELIEVYSKQLDGKIVLEAGLLKRVVRSGNIGRWRAEPTAVVLFPYAVRDNEARLYSRTELQENFPKAWDYLKRNKRALESREQGSFKDGQWYRFGRTQNLGMWEQPKLMVPYMITELGCYLDKEDNYYFINVTTGGYGITVSPNRVSLQYLCAILNSSVLDFFLKRVSTNFHGGYFAANKQFIEQLPVCSLNLENPSEMSEHDSIVRLVDKILAAKKKDAATNTADLEREIDERVYRLYGLTKDEIKIVEGSTAR